MKLRTLGGLRLEGSDFTQGRPLLLLAYLCVEGAQERRHLAELFWPRSGNAVRNLTTVLSRLNKVDSGLIEVDGHKLRSTLECDANQLISAFKLENHAEVIDHYQGRFLEGFHLKDMSEELEEWLYETREKLADHVRTALIRNAVEYAQQAKHAHAAELAAQAYHLHGASEPDETILKQLHVLLSVAGHSLAKDVQREAAMFGVTLDAGQAVHAQSQTESPEETINLPSFPTIFVGREQEVQSLAAQLQQANTRLLSIVAQGGMGKTRLAVEVGHKLSKRNALFSGGVVFISFVSVADPEMMIITIGEALGLSFSGQVEPKTQVFNYLADRRMLLILDNVEQLLTGVDLLAELLQHAPGMSMLVTSREALRLSAEHVFELKGLITPGDSKSDAVTLFIERAKMQQPEFTLDEITTPLVINICQLVAGMPLALELAASWLRALPLEDIAAEITSGIDFLVSNSRDVPERQRSIRVIFDTSWSLLDEAEQTAMRKLAVFRGGFNREAAREVAGVSLLTLASLIDKSFLSMADHKRYRRHPLMIQYTQAKLAEHPDESQQLRDKHAAYFSQLVITQERQITTANYRETVAVVERDFANIRAAWMWMVEAKHLELLHITAFVLVSMLHDRALELSEMLAVAIESLDEHDASQHLALGRLLVLQAWVLNNIVTTEEIQVIASKGIALLRPLDDNLGISRGLVRLGQVAWLKRSAEGGALLEEALTRAKRCGDAISTGAALSFLILWKRGQQHSFESITELSEQAINELRQLNRPMVLSYGLTIYGNYLAYHGHVDRGQALISEGLAVGKQAGIKQCIEMAFIDLGDIHCNQGHLLEAEQYFADAEKLANSIGFTGVESHAIAGLARVALARHDEATALRLLTRSLRLAWTYEIYFQMLRTLRYYAELYILQEQTTQAVTLFTFIREHNQAEERDQLESQAQLGKLAKQLPANTFQQAQAKAKELVLEDVVRDLLAVT